MAHGISFTARIVQGSGRGASLGVPTLNLALEDVPETLEEGIYACWVRYQLQATRPTRPRRTSYQLPAIMHYGPRPVFKDTKSCEVHIIEEKFEVRSSKLEMVTVEVVERIRDVQDFGDVESLKREIAEDIRNAKEILGLAPTSYKLQATS